MGVINYLLELLFPPRCSLCGELMDAEKDKRCFCDRCRAVWEQEKQALCPGCRRDPRHCSCMPKYNKNRTADSFRSLVFYDSENVKKLIRTVKTERNAALDDLMAKELAAAVIKYNKIDNDSVLAYPQRSAKSIKKYGKDHAAQICKKVSALTGVPVFSGIKHRRGAEQKTLTAKERGPNAAHSYYIPDKYKNGIRGKRVIFIDDVVTTAATSVVSAALCKANGAKSFSVLSIARTT
ncbi:MAG: ComF family protein [Clostridia bacterium]|nr:ComF family protein [Clostridia bacterium]